MAWSGFMALDHLLETGLDSTVPGYHHSLPWGLHAALFLRLLLGNRALCSCCSHHPRARACAGSSHALSDVRQPCRNLCPFKPPGCPLVSAQPRMKQITRLQVRLSVGHRGQPERVFSRIEKGCKHRTGYYGAHRMTAPSWHASHLALRLARE